MMAPKRKTVRMTPIAITETTIPIMAAFGNPRWSDSGSLVAMVIGRAMANAWVGGSSPAIDRRKIVLKSIVMEMTRKDKKGKGVKCNHSGLP